MAKGVVDRVPAVVTRTGCRRQFSEEDKRRIIEKSCRPGQSLSVAARRYAIDLRLLFRWRRALGIGRSAAPTSFVSVEVTDNKRWTSRPGRRRLLLLLNGRSPVLRSS
jgi:transposase-like protein